MQTTLINGQAYSFCDVNFGVGGIDSLPGFVGIPIKSISYNVGQAKSMNYENSKYATSVSYSKMTYTGSVTFTLDTAELLRDSIFLLGIRERSIVAMPATNISLSFVNKGKANTTTLHNVIFTTENMSANEGDDQMVVTCDFLASFVDFGGESITTSVIGTVLGQAADILNAGDNQGSIA